MESESKAELPNWFLNSQKRKVGDMSILRRTGGKKIKRKKHPSQRSLNILCIGVFFGERWPAAKPHTASGDQDWGPVRGAEAAGERAVQRLSSGSPRAPGPQTNGGNPTQSLCVAY